MLGTDERKAGRYTLIINAHHHDTSIPECAQRSQEVTATALNFNMSALRKLFSYPNRINSIYLDGACRLGCIAEILETAKNRNPPDTLCRLNESPRFPSKVVLVPTMVMRIETFGRAEVGYDFYALQVDPSHWVPRASCPPLGLRRIVGR